jgi:DNA polymerase-3 subunit gamma/tau
MPDELYYEPLTDKYRPRLLEEVVGQKTAVQILQGMLASKKIARTFLMTGPHSTGKTTLARIIARYVNCEKGPKKACGVCRSCKALDLGTHPDVAEIDAASNRGINEARELISQANLAPMHKKRVFIIDECHALTTTAAEALLKTLEEPASSTIFILCTTDPGKLKKTIRSRCKWFKLSPLSLEECGGLVHDIASKEGMPLSLDDGKLIARYAYGHPREALHLLENVIDFAAAGESTEDLTQVLSRVVNEALQMSPEMLAETYAENLLQVIPNVVYKLLLNVDNAPAFLERVCYIFRQNLVIYTGGFQAVDSYFDQWFSKKEWKRDWDIDHMLCIYKLHLEAMMQASTYTMDPYELLMSTAIQSIKIMMTCERNGS